MIKIYLDWNVFSKMKNGHNNELFDILVDKDKFFIPYSTSHIGDIFSSYSDDKLQLEYIKSDLDFISKLTNNFCISISGKELVTSLCDPLSLFKQRVVEKDIFTNFSLDSIKDLLNENELTKSLGDNIFSMLDNIPLGEEFAGAFKDPKAKDIVNVMFPNLEENQTLGGFFRSFGEMMTNYNEGDDWKKVRNYSQEVLGLNPDRVTNTKNPTEIIEAALRNNGIDIDKFLPESTVGPDWYNRLTNEYIKLDLYGFNQDRIRVDNKHRKETFKNTVEDAFHAGFAATCNYYIINDTKSYRKTKQVYKDMGLQTLVMTDLEFIEHFKTHLFFKTPMEHLKNLFILAQSSFKEYLKSDRKKKTFIYQTFLFNIFNQVEIIEQKGNTPIFRFNKAYFNNSTYYSEIEKFISDIYSLFNEDKNKLRGFNVEDIVDGHWDGGVWYFERSEFHIKLNKFQLELIMTINTKKTK